MIAKSSNPLSPSVNILIYDEEVNYPSIAAMSLFLEEDAHDVCTIQMRGIHPKAITDYIDAPVRVSISSGPGRVQIFCGYVAYVQPQSETRGGLVNGSPFQTANIVCLGASMDMKGSRMRVWEDASLSLIAQELCNRYNFSLDVLLDDYVYPRLVQREQSDWEFLIKTAHQFGCRVSVHGTHMSIWDPYKAVGRKASFERLVTTKRQTDAVPGTILSFKGDFGYISPSGYSTNFKIASMDYSGEITSVSTTDIPSDSWSGSARKSKFENELTGTPQNANEAVKYLKDINRHGFAFNAEIELIAGAGIVPGGVVEVTNYNSNFDGLWYVKSVNHDVGGSQYVTRIAVSRDFNDTEVVNIPNVEPASEAPDSVLVDGVWQASERSVVTYV